MREAIEFNSLEELQDCVDGGAYDAYLSSKQALNNKIKPATEKNKFSAAVDAALLFLNKVWDVSEKVAFTLIKMFGKQTEADETQETEEIVMTSREEEIQDDSEEATEIQEDRTDWEKNNPLSTVYSEEELATTFETEVYFNEALGRFVATYKTTISGVGGGITLCIVDKAAGKCVSRHHILLPASGTKTELKERVIPRIGKNRAKEYFAVVVPVKLWLFKENAPTRRKLKEISAFREDVYLRACEIKDTFGDCDMDIAATMFTLAGKTGEAEKFRSLCWAKYWEYDREKTAKARENAKIKAKKRRKNKIIAISMVATVIAIAVIGLLFFNKIVGENKQKGMAKIEKAIETMDTAYFDLTNAEVDAVVGYFFVPEMNRQEKLKYIMQSDDINDLINKKIDGILAQKDYKQLTSFFVFLYENRDYGVELSSETMAEYVEFIRTGYKEDGSHSSSKSYIFGTTKLVVRNDGSSVIITSDYDKHIFTVKGLPAEEK